MAANESANESPYGTPPTSARPATSGWIPVLLLALMVFFLAFAAMDAERRSFQARQEVRVQWQGKDLCLFADAGGPFVVTHLMASRTAAGGSTMNGAGPKGEVSDISAPLNGPVAITGPGSDATLSPEALSAMDWRDAEGRVTGPPTPDTPVRAVYYQARNSPPSAPDAPIPGGTTPKVSAPSPPVPDPTPPDSCGPTPGPGGPFATSPG